MSHTNKNSEGKLFRAEVQQNFESATPGTSAPKSSDIKEETPAFVTPPQTDSMEVHHHPQLHHKPKPWKEYLLEGLMIFIAVTLGFFAESLREHINNNEKEREYIKSLLNNLQQDTTDLNNVILDNQRKLVGLDSLLSLSSVDITQAINKQKLYAYSGQVAFYSHFSSNDATMTQLKNTGGFQYIRKGNVADSIARYDETMRNIYAAESAYAKSINDAMDAMSEVILFKVWHDTAYVKNNTFTNKDLPLLTTDQQKIERFFNKIYLERGWTQNYLNNLQDNLPYTLRLIKLLKEKYAE